MPEYDYHVQAWLIDGKYVACDHPKEMDCKCFGRLHEGQNAVRSDICKHGNHIGNQHGRDHLCGRCEEE